MKYRNAKDPYVYWYNRGRVMAECESCGDVFSAKNLPQLIGMMKTHYRGDNTRQARMAKAYRDSLPTDGSIPF